MGKSAAFMILGTIVAAFLWMVIAPIVIALRERRYDRRRIVADGAAAVATVTALSSPDRGMRQTLLFEFAPTAGGRLVRTTQQTSDRAIAAMGLQVGSSIPVRFIGKTAARAFSPPLVAAERADGASAVGLRAEPGAELFYVTFGPADKTAGGFPKGGRQWAGPGDISFFGSDLRLYSRVPRAFRTPKPTTFTYPISSVRNLEVVGDRLAFEIAEPDRPVRSVRFQAVDTTEAAGIAKRLPRTTNPEFVPAMAEAATFDASLAALSRWAPATYTLVSINVLAFVACALNGAGFWVPNAETMVRFGSDYTPLTLGGEWWRLLTSTFLHFGILHLAFNMYALSVNGAVAERIFGTARYLVIYLCAGVAGSVASLLWHPLVNGAGASGAIFGVFGALLAFFLRNRGGVPKSVLARQRTSIAIFIAYNLLNGARIGGIDNAAHLGGLCAGFLIGLLLARPLDSGRDERSWTAQWTRALTVVVGAALLVGGSLATGRLHPRTAYDENNHPIPRTALGPSVQSLAGVSIGMTLAALTNARGEPVRRLQDRLVYNAVDPAHDGLLDVYLTPDITASTSRVYAVVFTGDASSAPPELAYLTRLSTTEMIARYGEPLSRSPEEYGTSWWQFRTGVVAMVTAGRVAAYGIAARPD